MDDAAAKLFADYLVWAVRQGSYCARRWHRAHEAEDYAAVALSALWLAARAYRPGGAPFHPFARRCIVNALRNLLKSKASGLQTVPLEDVVIDRRVQDPAHQAEVRDLVAHVLSPLSDRQRAVVLARCEGRTFAQIGKEFGETKQAACLAFEVALCKMRQRLGMNPTIRPSSLCGATPARMPTPET